MFDDLLTELMGLTNTELDDRLRANELERRRLDAEQAALVTIAHHRQLYAVDEHRSINAYLRATLNCSSSEASRLRTVARAVDNIDGLGDGWLAGRFGISQVARLANVYGNRRIRDRLPAAAPLLIENAEQLPCVDFELCVDRFVHHADQDGAHDGRDDAVEHRTASVVDVGGMVDISAHGGDPTTSAGLIAIFDRFREAEYHKDLEARRNLHGPNADQYPLARTARQRRFDALTSIFRTAAAAENVGTVADPLVNVIIDAATWTELLTESGLTPSGDCGIDPNLIAQLVDSDVALSERRCETSTGTQLHPHDVLRAALAGHIRRVVVDSTGVVIDLGRRQRLFTGPARDAAKLLVTHCEHPGCELPADWCDIDHRVEWAAGGPTDQHNAGPVCASHNTAKTRRKLTVKRAVNGRNYTMRANGTIILPVGIKPPTFPHEDPDKPNDDHTPDEIRQYEQLARNRLAALTAA